MHYKFELQVVGVPAQRRNPHAVHPGLQRGDQGLKQKTYTREALLKSKRFSGYQQDFLAAILHKETYTIGRGRKGGQGVF